MKKISKVMRVVIINATILSAVFGFVFSNSTFASDLDFSVVVPDNPILEINLTNSTGSTIGATTTMDLVPDHGAAAFNEKTMVVSVGTNNEWGYNLVMTVSSTSLISTEDGSKTIPTLTAKDGGYTCTVDTASSCDFTANTWGYKLNAATNLSAATNYLPLQSSINLNNNTSKVMTPESTSVSFGSKINANLAPGTYQTTINFAATANPDPTPIMQNVSASDLASLTSSSSTVTLKDERDGTKYTIGKLADGNYWMLDNLALDLTNSTTLNNTTASNTNASATTLNYLKGTSTGTTSDKYATAGVSNWTSSYSYSAPLVNAASKDQTQPLAMEQSGTGKVGVYYNYCAASAGSYCYGNGTSAGSPSGNASEDICPKGWRMPTGGSSGEYQALYTAYSNNNANFVNALSAPLSGYFLNGSAGSQGSSGHFWSSTYGGGTADMYYLFVGASLVDPQSSNNRYYGYSIRCVYDIPTMQSVNSAKLAELIPNTGDTITLPDERDNTTYTVGRLADGKVWMLDNLALDLTNSTTLNNTTASNTNASATTLNYLKGTSTGTTSDKYATAGVSNWTESYSYSTPLINATNKDTTQPLAMGQSGTGKVGVYYNYCAASAGSYCYGNGTSAGSPSGNASEDICPKGWRMPTGGSSGEYQALYTAYSSNKANFVNALKTPLSGYFYNGSAYAQGSYGYFWSSTYYNTASMYYLFVTASNVNPQNYNYRRDGLSVRCLFGA